MSAGLLWPVVMRKPEGRCQSCAFNVRHATAVSKSVFPSPILRIYSLSNLKNHLRRVDKLFCEFKDFYVNFGVSITKILKKSGGWKRCLIIQF